MNAQLSLYTVHYDFMSRDPRSGVSGISEQYHVTEQESEEAAIDRIKFLYGNVKITKVTSKNG